MPSWGGVQHPAVLLNAAMIRKGYDSPEMKAVEAHGKKMWAENLKEMKQAPSIAVGLMSSSMPGNPTANHLMNKAMGAVAKSGGYGSLF